MDTDADGEKTKQFIARQAVDVSQTGVITESQPTCMSVGFGSAMTSRAPALCPRGWTRRLFGPDGPIQCRVDDDESPAYR